MGKTLFFIFISASLLILFIPGRPLFAAELVVADFERDGRNNLGGDIGTWNSNPLDTTQGCSMEIIPLYGVMDKENVRTNVLKISYDVASSGPAFNGVWFQLKNIDLTPYDEMSMVIKGDAKTGFTTQFKVELKNTKGERVVYILKGVTEEWQRLVIPIKELKAVGSMTDWSKIKELVFTFDDMTITYKEGALYVDNIVFSSNDQPKGKE